MEVQVFDNVLSEDTICEINDTMLSSDFKWFFSKSLQTVPDEYTQEFKKSIGENVNEYLLFSHDFYSVDHKDNKTYPTSEYKNIVHTVLDVVLPKLNKENVSIIRAKANLQTQYTDNKPEYFNTPHIDLLTRHFVVLYYVNDSDGDTVLFDKNLNIIKRISPKAGRVVVFDGDQMHTSSHPYSKDYRMVINMDLL